MTKKELLKLVDKFNNGTCSEAEKQILISYCEKVQLDEISNSWDTNEHKKGFISALQEPLTRKNQLSLIEK